MTLYHTSLLPVNTAVMELVGGPPLSMMGGPPASPGYKLRHLGVTERLLIGAVVNWPLRPWGAITDLAGLFHTSRPTIYAIGERAREIMFPRPGGRPAKAVSVPALPAPSVAMPVVAVTDTRIKRTLLTCLFPGGVTIRPMQDCLKVAFDQTRSVGFLSEFINEAGRRAGEILDDIDFSPLGEVIVTRDETYFDDLTFLITVEPRCLVIISGHVEEGCDAETWGVSLAIDHQTRGLRIIGLVEDAARYYPCSLREAELSVPVQKDVWHPMNKATQTVTDLERIALRKLERAEKLEQPLHSEPWDEAAFNAWAEAIAEAEKLVELSGQLRFWRGCLCDALEMVDWRSGEIRDREINQWLLDETIEGLRQLDHRLVQKLVTYLERQREDLLTFLDWLEVQLIPWQRRLARAFPDEKKRALFQAAVARAWRLSRAVVNGHKQFRGAAADAQRLVAELIADDETAHALAEELFTILERVIRTSCAAETINSVLKPYMWAKRHFHNRKTAQNWFNLFILWFDMHPFKRGKRQGKSPFQLAGIKVYTSDGRETDDWLEALGYRAGA
jgi:hypothetical protein